MQEDLQALMKKIPQASKLIRTIQRSRDRRGGILSIVDIPVRNVSIIKCVAGSIRSNHYHKKDGHFIYVLQGEIEYFCQAIRGNHPRGPVRCHRVHAGDSIFTPPRELHSTFFPIATTLIVSSLLPRDQKNYEKDTIRISLLTKENLSTFRKRLRKGD